MNRTPAAYLRRKLERSCGLKAMFVIGVPLVTVVVVVPEAVVTVVAPPGRTEQ
jgi:hypothetical protein